MNNKDLFSQKIYWLNKLSGDLPETNLSADYLRHTTSSDKNQRVAFDLSNELSESLLKFTQNSYLSLYLVLLTAFNILLYKYSGDREIIVGSPVYQPNGSNRLIDRLVPLRSTVTNQQTLKDLLLQVTETTIGAYSHPNYSLNELVQLLKIPTSENRCPIFDIVVLLENIHFQECLSNINNDLTVVFKVSGNRISGKFEYSDSLFRSETLEKLVAHYIQSVEYFIDRINTQVENLCLLTDKEKYRILEVFNKNSRDYPVEKTIHQLFEQQVERTSTKTAVVYEDIQLTYQQLNAKANQLARFLQSLGIKNGEFVGILQQRSANFAIAIIAILKAGGVYVPIDSTYPPERIRYMLSNSEVRILLTDSSFLNSLTGMLDRCLHLKSVVCLDIKPKEEAIASLAEVKICDRLDFEQLPTENLEISNRGIDPAYTIYTSGSTGLPKGAIIRHGGAINHIYAQFDALELTEALTFLQSAPASSDISVWQFLAPLLIGGKTVIVDPETVCAPQKLFKVIQEKRLTLVELVPVVLRALLEYISGLSPQQRLLPNLKWMMVTGESVPVELVNQWLRIYPEIKVVNAYGPTEAADDITQFIVAKPLPENQRTVPIGKPLANLNLYILDPKMQLVPIGVPGEICVSGFGVGLGYWKNEENTKFSFVPNPFPNTAKPLPGTTEDFIYKTGDLGRWLPDGNIEFLGRIDDQVKIRGFRIELGEIEALLNQHPAVRECAIALKEDSSGNKKLVGYVVPRTIDTYRTELELSGNLDGSRLSSELIPQLRNFLNQKLPEHMIPSAFVLLEVLPLTPSGKVDRKSLPVPDSPQPELEETFVAPRTAVEATLAEIWTQVLGVDRVGIHNNFFELGGDSIRCIQAISKANQAGLSFTPKQLFTHQTIAKLAAVVETSQSIQIEPITSDFSLTNLNTDELDLVLQTVEFEGGESL